VIAVPVVFVVGLAVKLVKQALHARQFSFAVASTHVITVARHGVS
jgi:hypothetical protein